MFPDLRGAVWRKSSRSGGNGGACVELAHVQGNVAVRDSKNPTGPKLAFAKDAFEAFLADVKDGRIN
jgi:Domain of unknown function (DUF397)